LKKKPTFFKRSVASQPTEPTEPALYKRFVIDRIESIIPWYELLILLLSLSLLIKIGQPVLRPQHMAKRLAPPAMRLCVTCT
jgi:hypothetical protein